MGFSTGMLSLYCSIAKASVFAALAWVKGHVASTILTYQEENMRNHHNKNNIAQADFVDPWAAAGHDARMG